MPIALADGRRLPIRSGSLSAVIAVMVHTDMPAYLAVVREAARILRPGGRVRPHRRPPCFRGAFADRSDREAIVLRSGYRDRHWTKESWTDKGIRHLVGATHRPLPDLLHTFLDAGLALERFTEGGAQTPITFFARAHEPTAMTTRTVVARCYRRRHA